MSSFLDPARALAQGRKNSEKFFSDMTGADDPATKGAARALIRALRRQVSKRGGPSAPGAAPHKQTGRLARSFGQEVVGGFRRVGTGYFVGRLLHGGVGKRNIAARPFMEAALAEALPDMEGEAVTELQRRGGFA